MSEFKGTKGKWAYGVTRKNKIGVKIDTLFIQLGTIYDDDCTMPSCCCTKIHANALLISKAPEMLEMLESVIRLKDFILYDETIVNESNIGEANALAIMIQNIEQLIKEATEL